MEAKGVLEKKATACSGWKERVAGGLEQLTDMKWADSMVEKARNNKEVVAIAIAAFSLGFFVSHKLFKNLEGFKKGDFRVQVDGAGRLTVSGARPSATPGSLHKVFQLPSTASLDDIAGRFESGVLTLTVPKRAYSGVPAPTSIEEIKRDKPGVAKEDVRPPPTKDIDGNDKKAASGDDSTTKPKEEIAKEEDVSNKPMDEATKNAQQQKQPEEASNHKQEQQKLAPEPEVKKEQEVKPEAPEKPAPEPEGAIDEKDKAVVDQESPAGGVRRRIEEEKAKAAAAAQGGEAGRRRPRRAAAGRSAWQGGWSS
ncbi:hypothetical protein TRIUR3_13025 [Triticum urartu]|uniref:Uncharacterized protein n=1 Tax=Triticum urartu TaxID=4572 RepID=M7YYR7_TRIUA|nr:hypothetical protein TRIUR3_13025 [Triticum urartu]